jgi:hypothetical protein
MSRYRAASTSVHRGNVLEELASFADDMSDASLKQFVLEAAEASTDEADQSLRIAALEIFRWLAFPDERYRSRVIAWVFSRIDAAPGRWPEERIYAISACSMWVHKPRVRDKLLRLACDETEPESIRSQALDCFSKYGPGEAPAKVIKTCQRFSGDTELGRTAAYVLRRCGVSPGAEPDAGVTRNPS